MSRSVSARQMGLARCDVCALVCRPLIGRREATCPRCGSLVHSRKPQSLARTWAFLISGYILYIPANILPMLDTQTFFGVQRDTIFSGIVYLWKGGSWGLALIVFCASIAVPLIKLLSLTMLAISVQQRSIKSLYARTRLCRVVDFIGRWSMLDVYVLVLLSALVQNRAVAQISPGPAAIAFASVVVLTLLAARSFDPRLMWDAAEERAASQDRAAEKRQERPAAIQTAGSR